MLRVLELFAGIGAASKALENLGIEHEIVDAVEIDKYAIKAFNAIHGTNFEPQDITEWDKDIGCDLIIHGSPCQDFSAAGLQAGGDKGSGTRSSLMYESIRIIEKLKPKYVVWENVKNLLSKKHRHNFDAYLEIMENLGYKNYYQVLDAQNYGVPQHRERCYTVSISGGRRFGFPSPVSLEKTVGDILEKDVDEKYYLSERMREYVLDEHNVQSGTKWAGRCKSGRINPTIAYAISVRGAGGGQRVGVSNFISNELPEDAPCGLAIETKARLRRLTPRECGRLMGFSDDDYTKIREANISDTQMYSQFGNSIVVDVLMAIFRELFKDGS